VLTHLAENLLLVWIEGSEAHTEELIRRFDAAPKPMYYQPRFPANGPGQTTSTETGQARTRWTRRLRALRLCPRPRPPPPLYAAMARNWGVTVTAAEVAEVRDAEDVDRLVAAALGRHRPAA
jgi:hypothetical protein